MKRYKVEYKCDNDDGQPEEAFVVAANESKALKAFHFKVDGIKEADIISVSEVAKNGRNTSVVQSDYTTARKIAMFISFLGWIVFAGGIIAAFVGMESGLQSRYGGGVSILATLPGFSIAVSGLFLVAAGQVTRATVDNADHTREILSFIREKA